jgi:hypothetical protein
MSVSIGRAWGYCPVCHKERKLIGMVLKQHRMYMRFSVLQEDKIPGYMVFCEGSGKPPVDKLATVYA